jgi:hypothetical protein
VPSPSGFAHVRLRAPRARDGRPGGETSDRYSLGCVAFWRLIGKPVFSGDPMAMLVSAPGRDRSDDILSLQSID